MAWRGDSTVRPLLQLARHNKELQSMLKPGGQVDGDEALEFYAKHTAQIEVTRAAQPLPNAHTRCRTSNESRAVPICWGLQRRGCL